MIGSVGREKRRERERERERERKRVSEREEESELFDIFPNGIPSCIRPHFQEAHSPNTKYTKLVNT